MDDMTWMRSLDADLDVAVVRVWLLDVARETDRDRARLIAALKQVPDELLPALLEALGGVSPGGEG